LRDIPCESHGIHTATSPGSWEDARPISTRPNRELGFRISSDGPEVQFLARA
jgi:hypothetical protein